MHMVYTRGTSCGSMADSDWINRRLPILCDSPLAPEISSFEWATRFVCLLGARGVLGSSVWRLCKLRPGHHWWFASPHKKLHHFFKKSGSKMVCPYPVSKKHSSPVPRADFFEPGSKIPLPRSPGADFFETGSKNPPGAAFGGAPRALRALGRGIS